MFIYKNFGDSILVTGPGADDAIVHVFMTEYERRETLTRARHNADLLENRLAQQMLLFHGPAAKEAQLALIKSLCNNPDKLHDRKQAIENLGDMIVEGESMHHA